MSDKEVGVYVPKSRYQTCLDCKELNFHQYMVQSHVWLEAVGSKKGFLHIGCLEKRLKRHLKRADFIEAPINDLILWAFERGARPNGLIILTPVPPMPPIAPHPWCHSASDGECHWKDCPQLRDGEPEASGRHCPLDNAPERD